MNIKLGHICILNHSEPLHLLQVW